MAEPLTAQERAELRRQAEEAMPWMDAGYRTLEVPTEAILALLDERDKLAQEREGCRMQLNDLRDLQAEVGAWVRKNFGEDVPLLDQASVVCEEAGELIHHTLKQKQGIRVGEDHVAGMRDAVADVIISVCAFGAVSGIDVSEAVDKAWAEVKQRDWPAERQP